MNIFDYAVAFDKKFILDDRVCRFPTLDFYRKSVFLDNLNAPRFNAIEALRNKTGFCSFIYSNPKAHPNRDLLFNKMSEYRRVDSLGPHLNNVGTLGSRSSENWRQEAIEMKRPYKFSIASENATYNGYATEKILSSFQAYSVPIYWGDPSISAEFNPKAFVDANAYDSFDEVVEIVKEIDQNDDIWLQMVSAPIMTEEQMTLYREDHGKYVDFIDHIFNPDISDAKRAPSGFWTDNYFDWFRRCGMRSSFIRSILAGLRGS